MHELRQSFRIAGYHLKQLPGTPRIYLILLCNFIFLQTQMQPFGRFLTETNMKATPFLFPFLFSDEFLSVCFLSGILLLFSNAPFFNASQKFIMIRVKKETWALGQIWYMVICSLLYFVLLYLLSVLSLGMHLSFSREWGAVWNTLGRTTVGVDAGIFLVVPVHILNTYTPIQTATLVCLFGAMNGIFLGLLLFAIHLFLRRELGIAVAALLILFPTRGYALPRFCWYSIPTLWMNLDFTNGSQMSQAFGVRAQFLILGAYIVIMIALCIVGIRKMDIPEVEI